MKGDQSTTTKSEPNTQSVPAQGLANPGVSATYAGGLDEEQLSCLQHSRATNIRNKDDR